MRGWSRDGSEGIVIKLRAGRPKNYDSFLPRKSRLCCINYRITEQPLIAISTTNCIICYKKIYRYVFKPLRHHVRAVKIHKMKITSATLFIGGQNDALGHTLD